MIHSELMLFELIVFKISSFVKSISQPIICLIQALGLIKVYTNTVY